MKKKLTYIIFFLIFLSVILITYYTNNKIIRPNQHALLLKDTEKYANNLNYYYPFITGAHP
jgi:cbb3-type cytochrome oxidase subunit 3